MILDVQMPRMDGLETLERLRARDPELPVLFLTARDAVADRVQGLRAGADDYVTKPFDLDEVAARVEALLRRAGRTQQSVSPVLTVADLTLDLESHDVRRGGEDITLTNTAVSYTHLTAATTSATVTVGEGEENLDVDFPLTLIPAPTPSQAHKVPVSYTHLSGALPHLQGDAEPGVDDEQRSGLGVHRCG